MINIKAEANKEIEKTRRIILSFPWENRWAYSMWLAQTYQMVNHSTRLVALAGAYTPIDRNELHARFVDHAKEERGHQLICVSDLKTLGYTLKDFACLPQSASMYQVQYYWIQHRGAVSFFGYTLALECLAAEFGAEVYKRCEASHGKNATKFLRVHSNDDVEHTQSAFTQLAQLSAGELALVVENLALSSELYRSMLETISNSLAPTGEAPVKKVA